MRESRGRGSIEDALRQPTLAKAEVDYQHPANGKDVCSRCTYFIAESKACELVKGTIFPEDWCNKFEED